MNFSNYTIFDALFLSVVIDFPFLRLNQYFEIAKFVYVSSFVQISLQTKNFKIVYSDAQLII